MKTFSFRHPGFAGEPLVQVPIPQLSDLTDKELGRLIRDMRFRIMIRDTMASVERLFWTPRVSVAVWSAVHDAAMEQVHIRAATEHVQRGFAFTGRGMAMRGPGDAELELRNAARRAKRPRATGLGAYLRAAMTADVPPEFKPSGWQEFGGVANRATDQDGEQP